jgi:hypothetical protein
LSNAVVFCIVLTLEPIEPMDCVLFRLPLSGVCMRWYALSVPYLVLANTAEPGADGDVYFALINSSNSESLRFVIESPSNVHTSFFS